MAFRPIKKMPTRPAEQLDLARQTMPDTQEEKTAQAGKKPKKSSVNQVRSIAPTKKSSKTGHNEVVQDLTQTTIYFLLPKNFKPQINSHTRFKG